MDSKVDTTVWENALKLLKYDPSVDKFAYDSLLMNMKVEFCDPDVMILSVRDEYSLTLVKGQTLGQTVQKAINSAAGKTITVKFVLQGDEKIVVAVVQHVYPIQQQAFGSVEFAGVHGCFRPLQNIILIAYLRFLQPKSRRLVGDEGSAKEGDGAGVFPG